ncbi:MAG: hypothetical protein JW384_00724 [Nitrosomonadaceae bacterium]|nr:hypothetical protein [Nitrosomonadaceae bacterium]
MVVLGVSWHAVGTGNRQYAANNRFSLTIFARHSATKGASSTLLTSPTELYAFLQALPWTTASQTELPSTYMRRAGLRFLKGRALDSQLHAAMACVTTLQFIDRKNR